MVILILIYRKASDFLQNQEGGVDVDEESISEGEDVTEKGSTTITYSKLKSFASHDGNTSLIVEDSEEVEVIEHCTVEVTLRFSHENNYLSGFIDNFTGMMHHKSKRVNCIRFHIALLPYRKRTKTAYRLLKDLNARIAFGIGSVTIDVLSDSKLRVRLYGRRVEFGVPINRERCIGEFYIRLDECLQSLSSEEEVRITQAIFPKSQQFPSHDDDLFSDET